jgi:hypothetical protein
MIRSQCTCISSIENVLLEHTGLETHHVSTQFYLFILFLFFKQMLYDHEQFRFSHEQPHQTESTIFTKCFHLFQRISTFSYNFYWLIFEIMQSKVQASYHSPLLSSVSMIKINYKIFAYSLIIAIYISYLKKCLRGLD